MEFKFAPGTKGIHAETVDGKPVLFDAKDDPVIPSSNDLEAKYPGKFVRVVKGTATATATPPPEESQLGEDVTSKYKSAGKAGLLVFKGEEGLFVASEDEPDFALNAEPLSGRQISKFVKQQVEAE